MLNAEASQKGEREREQERVLTLSLDFLFMSLSLFHLVLRQSKYIAKEAILLLMLQFNLKQFSLL